MYITKIEYQNYRNMNYAVLTLDQGVNILCGNNAQGKTSALEGIYHFAIGRSFRGEKDKEVISFGENRASVRLLYHDANRENCLEMMIFSDKSKQMKKNGVTLKKTADLIGNLHCVLFCPEHLMMIKGAPQLRRAFLNGAISQLKPSYAAALADYQRILKQRNALLKDEYPGKNRPLLEVLSAQLAEVNTHITLTRRNYTEILNESINRIMLEMSDGNEHTAFAYESHALDRFRFDEATGISEKLQLTEQFYQYLIQNLDRDMAAQTTLSGAHRDDLSILINGHEARKYASQGQDRSLALAMKLAEGELCKTACGEYPVFLFDDVLSELDSRRQHFLMEKIRDRQVILTACNEELFDGMDITMIYVENGMFG